MRKKLLLRFFPKRVRTPTFIQMEMAECGAVSLGIILAYFKKFLKLEELREICGVTRDGSNALQITKGAEKLGLRSHGIRAEIEDLYKLKPPFILFWKFYHFVVFEGFGKNCFYINDPASGPRKVSFKEFDESFTGVAILLEKKEDFVKSGSKDNFFLSIKKRLKGSFATLLYLFLASLSLSIITLAFVVFTQLFFDKILKQDIQITTFFFALLASVILSGILTWLQRSTLMLLNLKLSIKGVTDFFLHILRLPISFFMHRYPGEIAWRFSVADTVIQTLTGQLIISAVNLIFVLFYLVVMVQISPLLSLIAFLSAIFNLLTLALINRSRMDAFARLQQDLGKNQGISVGALRNITTLKSFGLESDFFSRWAGTFAKSAIALQEIGFKDVFLTSVPTLLQLLTTAFILYLGASEVMHGSLTIGMLLALQLLIQNFLSPFARFVNLGQIAQETKVNLFRIDDVLNHKIEDVFLKNNNSGPPTRLSGHLEIDSLTFGYDPYGPPLIENFSLKIKSGGSCALVGPSGCGKTTLAKLISGLYKPWSGKILFDGKELSEIERATMIASFSTVDQNIFLFEGSFRDNITLFDSTLFEEDIIQAAKDSLLHDDIVASDQGYNHKILEEGKNLSGGQRQRVEIARALVRNPSYLILDEATSSLDSMTEEQIMKNIRRRGMSLLMVAHRLSTIKECDEIIVLDKGKIVERGSHEELMQRRGLYFNLATIQGGR